MMARFLPARHYLGTGSLMSILRVLIYNPALAFVPTVPKYEDVRSFKLTTMFKAGDNGFSRLLKNFRDFAQSQKSLTWNMQYPDPHTAKLLLKTMEQHKHAYTPFSSLSGTRRGTVTLNPDAPRPDALTACSSATAVSIGDVVFPRNFGLVLPRISNYSQASCVIAPSVGAGHTAVTDADLAHFASTPLEPLSLQRFVAARSLSERCDSVVASTLPFDVSNHSAALSHVAQGLIARLQEDVARFAEEHNSAHVPKLIGMLDQEVHTMLAAPAGAATDRLLELVTRLINELVALHAADLKFSLEGVDEAVGIANHMPVDARLGGAETESDVVAFLLRRVAGREATVSFEFLAGSLLSTTFHRDLLLLNPFLAHNNTAVAQSVAAAGSQAQSQALARLDSLLVGTMARATRVAQIRQALTAATDLQRLLKKLARLSPAEAQGDPTVFQSLVLKADDVATRVTTQRHYVRGDPSGGSAVVFDPRLLLFEFTYAIVLRQAQVELVELFMTAVARVAERAPGGANPDSVEYDQLGSLCHQMIMGAGKTTVVGPLLCLLLADGKSLVTQCVPAALLEFSRATLRERFSAIIRKPIYTFSFDRFKTVTPALLRKITRARNTRAIMVSTPTAIKSFMLKYVELLHLIDFERLNKDTKQKRSMLEPWRKQAAICHRVLSVFKTGVLLMDEVDLILHPLKSELNFPIGPKYELDLTHNRAGDGLRWHIPWFLLDAIFFGLTGKLTVPFAESAQAHSILTQIQAALQRGMTLNVIQRTPHIVVLSRAFYKKELRPLLAEWLLLWLSCQPVSTMADKDVLKYLLDRPKGSTVNVEAYDDEFIKMLNLAHDWLHSFLPHCLSKINRVGFGLLSPSDLAQALALDPHMPKSRRLTAVPFVGKDVPSRSSEFSHPDITIGLTILAFRYEGLRRTDFSYVLGELQKSMWDESGPVHLRPSSKLFVRWVELAGGRVRGSGLGLRAGAAGADADPHLATATAGPKLGERASDWEEWNGESVARIQAEVDADRRRREEKHRILMAQAAEDSKDSGALVPIYADAGYNRTKAARADTSATSSSDAADAYEQIGRAHV